MTPYRIPFNRPGLAGNELRYIRESVESGRISGDGVFTERCRRLLEELLGAPRVLLTTWPMPRPSAHPRSSRA
jgi:dTDP-4-amino-4,6-dideoxygalactose transaminase